MRIDRVNHHRFLGDRITDQVSVSPGFLVKKLFEYHRCLRIVELYTGFIFDFAVVAKH